MSEQEPSVKETEKASGNPEVSYDTYKRTIGEIKKLREQVKQFEQEKESLTEKQLAEQNEWKKLAETYKTKFEVTEKTLKEQEESIVNGLKYSEFTRHLGGQLVSESYASFIPFDKIVLNPETKKVEESSVKDAVSMFLKEHSALVKFPQGRLPNMNGTGSPSIKVDTSKMTPDELRQHISKMAKDGHLK